MNFKKENMILIKEIRKIMETNVCTKSHDFKTGQNLKK